MYGVLERCLIPAQYHLYKLNTNKSVRNVTQTIGRFVVRSLEKHLNYIHFFLFKSINFKLKNNSILFNMI